MKLLKVVQILALMMSLSACEKAKTRSKIAAKKAALTGADKDKKTADVVATGGTGTMQAGGPAPAAPSQDAADKNKPAEANQDKPAADTSLPVPTAPAAKPDADVDEKLKKAAGPVVDSKEVPKEAKKELADKDSGTVKVAEDTAEIKAAVDQVRLSFKDLSVLKKLSKTDAMLNGEVVSNETALKQVNESNEEVLACKVNGAEKFHQDDYLKMTASKTELADKENFVFGSELKFENKNGVLTMSCIMNTEKIDLGILRSVTLQKVIKIQIPKWPEENPAGYKSGETIKRLTLVAQIQDADLLAKTKTDGKSDKGFALVDGKMMELDQARKEVSAGKAASACTLLDITGKLDKDKVFVLSRADALELTELKTTVMGYIFVADAENLFRIACHQSDLKDTTQIRKATQGAIKFGGLGRKEYNKKIQELQQTQAQQKQAPAK